MIKTISDENILILGFTYLTFTQGSAQTVVQGNVFNSENEPIGFANEKLTESKRSVSADPAGHYILVRLRKELASLMCLLWVINPKALS